MRTRIAELERGQALLMLRSELNLNLVGDGVRHLLLHGENPAMTAFIAARPQMGLVFHTNELSGDAHAVGFCPDAAFEDVVDAKLLPNLVDCHARAFVLHR